MVVYKKRRSHGSLVVDNGNVGYRTLGPLVVLPENRQNRRRTSGGLRRRVVENNAGTYAAAAVATGTRPRNIAAQ